MQVYSLVPSTASMVEAVIEGLGTRLAIVCTLSTEPTRRLSGPYTHQHNSSCRIG